MAQVKEFLGRLWPYWTTIVGAVGSIGTFSSVFLGLLADPVWTVRFIEGTIAVLVVLLLLAMFLTEEIPVIGFAPASERGKRRRIAPGSAIGLLAAMMVVFAMWGGSFVFGPADQFDSVMIDNVEIIDPEFETIDGKMYSLGKLADAEDQPKQFFTTGSYCVKFTIAKAHRHKSIAIEKLLVEVTRYTDVTHDHTANIGAMPFRDDNLFWVAIDDPGRAKKMFNGQHFLPTKDGAFEQQRFAASLLNDDAPEVIKLIIDAKKPGIYEFAIKLDLLVGRTRESVTAYSDTVYYPPPVKWPDRVEVLGE